MTVKELIDILSGYPQDATVEIENECGSHVEPTPIYYPSYDCVFFET